jgi:hypothetical protein
MELLTPSLSHACILATCTDQCLHPGDHHRFRLGFHTTIAKQHSTEAFGTWLAQGAELITIGKYHIGVHSVSGHVVFRLTVGHAVPRVSSTHYFIGQFVIDNDNKTPVTPRVLIFDVAKVQGVLCSGKPVHDRCGCLQQKLVQHLGPICTLQWVGECRVLSRDMGSG